MTDAITKYTTSMKYNIKHSFHAFGTLAYWKDMLYQFTGWHPLSYTLLGFAIGLQALTFVNSQMTMLDFITMVASLLGVITILAISQAKSLNGFTGLLSVFGLIYVAHKANNNLQIVEQIIYACTLDIPVLLNVDWNKHMSTKISKLKPEQWLYTLISWALLWASSAYLITLLTHEPRPITDALVFATATVAGILQFLKKREAYIGWLATGIVSLALWYLTYQQGAASIAMLLSSMVYVLNDIIGFTVSPWFSKKGRQRLAQQEQKYHQNY